MFRIDDELPTEESEKSGSISASKQKIRIRGQGNQDSQRSIVLYHAVFTTGPDVSAYRQEALLLVDPSGLGVVRLGEFVDDGASFILVKAFVAATIGSL